MDNFLSGKMTFTEIYKMIQRYSKDDGLYECFLDIVNAAMLIFPAFVSEGTALYATMNIATTEATLAGTGIAATVEKVAKSAAKIFQGRKYEDFTPDTSICKLHNSQCYTRPFLTLSTYILKSIKLLKKAWIAT